MLGRPGRSRVRRRGVYSHVCVPGRPGRPDRSSRLPHAPRVGDAV